MNYIFSDKVNKLQPSAIREILKYTSVPGVISFAAGNPSADAFPSKEIAEISASLLQKDAVSALQYSVTEGYTPLRDLLKQRMANQDCFNENIDDLIITSGAQQATDLATKVLCNEGDTVICENPTFIGSLNAFRSYNLNLCGVPMKDDGMDIEKLEEALKTEKNVKLIYTIPNFQNPTGITTSLENRKKIYELAKKYNVMILEDNPYGDIRFKGESVASIKSLDSDGRVIYVGSFSKVLSPGMRVGYVSAPSAVIQKITVCKQTNDVHTNIWSQIIAYRFMTEYDFEAHLECIRNIYLKKSDFMIDMMSKKLPSEITFTRPDGGLFVWCDMPEGADMLAFTTESAQKGAAVVPGTAFLTDESEKSCGFRLTYATPTEDEIERGLDIIAELLKKYI